LGPRSSFGAHHLHEPKRRALKGGGAKGTMRSLYPYDGPMFPRGMLAPTLMWDGADGKAVYVPGGP
jgi:hypothetical protein